MLLAQADAATITWAGATGDMGVSTNWAPNATIGGASNAFVFAGTTAVTSATNTAATVTASSITFNADAAAYTISGNAVTLAGNIANNSANLQTLNVPLVLTGTRTVTTSAGGGDITIGGVISGGTNGLIKSGSGTLTLTGINTYTGVTTVSSGTLVLTGTGSVASTTVSVAGGNTLILDDRGTGTLGAHISGTTSLGSGGVGGSLIYQGPNQDGSSYTQAMGRILFNSGVSTVTLNYSGTNAATVSTVAVVHTAGSGGIGLINGVNLGANTGTTSVSKLVYASGSPTMYGTTAAGTGISAGTYNTKIVAYLLGESGTASGANGTATGTANTFLTYNTSTGFRPLNPTDEFTHNAFVTGNNTYITEATTASANTSINSLVINGGDVNINNGVTLTDSSGALLFVTSNTIGGTGSFKLSSGSQEGIVTVNQNVSAAINAGITLSGTTTLYSQGSLAIGGAISGAGYLGMSGSVTLSGVNTYSGTTALTGNNTVVVGSDSAFGTSAVLVNSAGLWRGDGQSRTIGNTITVSNSAFTIGGSSDLTFSGGANGVALAIAQYANQSVIIANTGITTISGAFSLNTGVASGTNNGSAFLRVNTGADVRVTGAIQDNNNGNATVPVGAKLRIELNGAVSNVTISPTVNNTYGYGSTSNGTSEIQVNYAGYNTVTLGGPGGAGAVITPFGYTSIYLNNGKQFFFQAETDGQILGNSISGGGSTIGFGFTGANSMTLGGAYSIGSGSGVTIANIASGTLTFANAITSGAGKSFSVAGWGTTVLSSSSSLVGTTGGFAKTGSGVLKISGSVNLTGATNFNGGTVILDYGSNSVGATTRLTAATSGTGLLLSGVNLQLSEGSYAQTVVSGTTYVGAGQTSISRTNGGTSTIALGNLTRSVGATIDFGEGSSMSSVANTYGIVGGWATANGGADWAVANGASSAITALSSYTSLASSFAAGSDTANSLATDSVTVTGAAGWTTNSLKITTTAAGNVLDLGSNVLTLRSGGILFTGADDYAINGGSIKTSTSGSDLVINQYGTGKLTINSAIPDNSTSSLTKTGSGVLELTGANLYNNGTYLNGGTIQVASDLSLGGSGVNARLFFNGGTLEITADGFSATRGVALGANGGTVLVDTGTSTLSGVISGGSYGSLTKTGAGTLILAGANTYVGPTNINAGTLKLGNALGLGASAVTGTTGANAYAPVNVNGGTLDLAGYTAAVGNVVMTGGNIVDSVGGGALNAYSYTLQSGTASAVLGDLVATGATGSSINLYKTTAGTAVIAGANTYTGTTFIDEGTLQVGDGGTTGQLGMGSVSNDGNLAFNRSNSYTVSNAIYGTGSLTQAGTGKTTLTGVNSYTGATYVNKGQLDVNSSLAAGSAVTVASQGTLGGSGTINGTTTVVGGAINGSGLKLVGAAVFSGNSTLAGTTTFENGLTVASGTLALTGHTTGNVGVDGTLAADGTVVGTLGIHNGGALAVGRNTVTGDLVVDSGAKVSMTLNSLADYSQISVSGGITLNGTLALTLGGSIGAGNQFVLIDNTGSSLINTTFSTITVNGQAVTLSSSNTFTVGTMLYDISYGTAAGDDVTLTALAVVPEPSTWAMVVGGVGMLIGFGRRFRRQD